MKVATLASAICTTVATGVFAFLVLLGGTVKGSVTPINAAVKCWAISQSDTFQTNIVNGSFELTNVKPGTYRIAIEGIPPYKNAVRDGIDVRNGEVTDIGEVRLQQ